MLFLVMDHYSSFLSGIVSSWHTLRANVKSFSEALFRKSEAEVGLYQIQLKLRKIQCLCRQDFPQGKELPIFISLYHFNVEST